MKQAQSSAVSHQVGEWPTKRKTTKNTNNNNTTIPQHWCSDFMTFPTHRISKSDLPSSSPHPQPTNVAFQQTDPILLHLLLTRPLQNIYQNHDWILLLLSPLLQKCRADYEPDPPTLLLLFSMDRCSYCLGTFTSSLILNAFFHQMLLTISFTE